VNAIKKDGCSISTFVDYHTRNYITLTNVVNPDLIGVDPDVRPELANIYYRVIAKEGSSQLVREFADISADGFARNGTFKQSIDVKLGMSSFLPVFNFSLYRTDTESDKESPDGRNDDIPLVKSPTLIQPTVLPVSTITPTAPTTPVTPVTPTLPITPITPIIPVTSVAPSTLPVTIAPSPIPFIPVTP